ncbi:hypothetical protein PanWU01x14_088040 [Parasponia andersonii]|uniref:Uncharacterized protein n=1 Tax=Parasponia andersonii TaxID=3476 RepID=A0A2P5D7T7_PARAD|nr:hypothetical protein PanWU01x14_088040 [Parasponia andersonii]
MVTIGNPEYRQLQKILFLKNGIIPNEIWPRPEDDAPWEHYSPAYTARMDKDMKHFLTHINNGPWMPPEENQSTADSTDAVNYQASVFQDSQDPYDQSPLTMSQINQELTRTTTWQRVQSERDPRKDPHSSSLKDDIMNPWPQPRDSSDSDKDIMNSSPSHEPVFGW